MFISGEYTPVYYMRDLKIAINKGFVLRLYYKRLKLLFSILELSDIILYIINNIMYMNAPCFLHGFLHIFC